MGSNNNNNNKIITAAAMFVSVHIKMARPGSNVNKKPERIQN